MKLKGLFFQKLTKQIQLKKQIKMFPVKDIYKNKKNCNKNRHPKIKDYCYKKYVFSKYIKASKYQNIKQFNWKLSLLEIVFLTQVDFTCTELLPCKLRHAIPRNSVQFCAIQRKGILIGNPTAWRWCPGKRVILDLKEWF